MEHRRAPLRGSLPGRSTTSSLTTGNHSIRAGYGGDPNCAASTSAVLTQVVNSPDGEPAFSLGYCAPAVNAPPPGLPCMPVPVTAQQSTAAAIAFCTSAYRDVRTQQACIASLVPNVGGFICAIGCGLQAAPKPAAPRPPGRYCTLPDTSMVWVIDAGPVTTGAVC